TSGRISSEILVKASRAGVPIVASRAAPTSLAIRFAERLGVTLVGFVRGGRMNVYTYPGRII
ncbi:MAG: formate dehydrogenase accessory sulfurtransferase FdhD, partial [bacterium]